MRKCYYAQCQFAQFMHVASNRPLARGAIQVKEPSARTLSVCRSDSRLVLLGLNPLALIGAH